jgi:hypothetical protein
MAFPKWRWRCSGPGGSAACAGRGRPPRLLCPVPGVCARARLKRRAPARLGAAATNCGPAPCSGGRGAPRCEMGTPGAPRSSRRGSQPLARGTRRARRGRGRLGTSELRGRAGEFFGAAGGGGMSTLSDEACAGMCASCRGNAIFEHTFRRSWRYRAAAGLHSSSKDRTACALYLCTPGPRQTMTCVGSGALAL